MRQIITIKLETDNSEDSTMRHLKNVLGPIASIIGRYEIKVSGRNETLRFPENE